MRIVLAVSLILVPNSALAAEYYALIKNVGSRTVEVQTLKTFQNPDQRVEDQASLAPGESRVMRCGVDNVSASVKIRLYGQSAFTSISGASCERDGRTPRVKEVRG